MHPHSGAGVIRRRFIRRGRVKARPRTSTGDTMKKYNVRNRRVLITGASSGIGRELSTCFAAEGCELFLGAHPSERERLSEWAVSLRDKYRITVHELAVDLADGGGPEAVYDAVAREGGIDVLVNNAGCIAYGPFHELPLERQKNIIRVNVMAYFTLMRLCIPGMIARGGGRVLNISSVSAFQPTARHAVYGATKAFVQSLSESAARELRGTGVSVMTANPSYTDTPLLCSEGFPEKLRWYAIGGLGDPAVIAKKIFRAFLRGKPVYIPGFLNWCVHSLLVRLLPRSLICGISYIALGKRDV